MVKKGKRKRIMNRKKKEDSENGKNRKEKAN